MHRPGTKHIVRHMQKICRTVVRHIQVHLYKQLPKLLMTYRYQSDQCQDVFKPQYTSYMRVGSGGVCVENTLKNYLGLCFIHGVIKFHNVKPCHKQLQAESGSISFQYFELYLTERSLGFSGTFLRPMCPSQHVSLPRASTLKNKKTILEHDRPMIGWSKIS